MTININTFKDYLFESLDELPEVHHDYGLISMAKMMLPKALHDSVDVLFTDEMNKNDLRVIRLKNAAGHVEYHVHNNSLMPGSKSTNENKKPFMHAVKIIYNDAQKVIGDGGSVQLQSMEGSHQHATYKKIADRLAAKHGKTVTDIGLTPLTSMPVFDGHTLIIK